jgi:AcrR family transcriptional regulator
MESSNVNVVGIVNMVLEGGWGDYEFSGIPYCLLSGFFLKYSNSCLERMFGFYLVGYMSLTEEKTRCRLLDAAGLVFADRGFEKATVREICTRAEVNLGAVNYHFGDKFRLYVETLLHAHEVVFDQVPLPEWTEQTSAEQKLTDFIRTMLRRMLLAKQLPWQARLMMREFVAPTAACQELAEKYIRPHHRMLLDILAEIVPEEVSESHRHQIAFSIVGQCLFYKMNLPIIQTLVPAEQLAADFNPDQLAAHIAGFSLAALGRHPLWVSPFSWTESAS